MSTYDFSTLYTTLPHNLIKEKLLDLIGRIFNKKEGITKLYLACNNKKAFSLLQTIIEDITCQNVCDASSLLFEIFILDLALSYTDKLLVFRWIQIALLL